MPDDFAHFKNNSTLFEWTPSNGTNTIKAVKACRVFKVEGSSSPTVNTYAAGDIISSFSLSTTEYIIVAQEI